MNPSDKFGRLTVIETFAEREQTGKLRKMVRCRCECGVEKAYRASNLIYKLTRSCGCLRNEVTAAARCHPADRPLQTNNSTGQRGVYIRCNGRFAAEIRDAGRKLSLGVFEKFEEAKAARLAAEARIWAKRGALPAGARSR